MTREEFEKIARHAASRTAPENFEAVDVNEALIEGLSEYCSSIAHFMDKRYELFEIVTKVIDEVVPPRVIDRIGAFADVTTVAQGERIRFKIKTGKLRARRFVTAVALSGVYETFRLDSNTLEIFPKAIGGAFTLDFERILDGAESLADSMDALADGMVEAVYQEIHAALRASLNDATRPPKNKVIENKFDGDKMFGLISTVRAYGRGAVIVAPNEFVGAMGADAIVPVATYGSPAAAGIPGVYHPQDIDAIHNTGYINIFRGTPIVALPNSFTDTTNTYTQLDPQIAYVFPTDGEKVVKVGYEGATQMWSDTNRDQSLEVNCYRKMGVAITTLYDWGIYQNTGIPQPMKQ